MSENNCLCSILPDEIFDRGCQNPIKRTPQKLKIEGLNICLGDDYEYIQGEITFIKGNVIKYKSGEFIGTITIDLPEDAKKQFIRLKRQIRRKLIKRK